MTDDTDLRHARPRFADEDIPVRMRGLPRDHRGFPVPWFVAWLRDGKPVNPGFGEPDFRIVDTAKLASAVRARRCWVCGHPLGRFMTFVLGPMCAVNRINSEPPSHRDCAHFTAMACPFLSRPRMRRNYKDKPETREPAGVMIERNPGAVCLWTTTSYKLQHLDGKDAVGNAGVLFEVGEPERVEWYAEGKIATRPQVDAAILSGLPILRGVAQRQGPDAVAALPGFIDRLQPWLPKL
jgi:hypothetical protein